MNDNLVIKFKEMGSVNIDEWNGKFVYTDFDPNNTTINTIEYIDFKANEKNWPFFRIGIKSLDYYDFSYVGMINKEKKPHGFGRAYNHSNYFFLDG
jgi:hypothetical protein